MTTSATPAFRRWRRGEIVALAVALGWSVALIVVVVVVPVYTWQESSSTNVVTGDSATLVEVNGTGVLLTVAVPLVLSAAVVGALWLRGNRRGGGPLAWVCAGLCVAFTLVAMLSIGPLVVPVAGCLLYACAMHGRRT